MTQIKLSICIPTYNRAPYLRTALECLAEADFSFTHEIVISDNASTDGTPDVVQEFIAKGLPILYLRAPANAGAAPNLTNAIQHASGEYMIYQGDDDLLILPRIAEVVAYLDANPDVTACHAPWYLYNQVANVDERKFYDVDADVKFERQDFMGVFEFLFQKHIFPEIAIYRLANARAAFVPRHFCFWPFAFLAHFLDDGAVTFLKEPFYRSVTLSQHAPSRQQAGNEEVMTSWDTYRGGLEYFLHFGTQRGRFSEAEEARALYDRMCHIFTALRMSVAIRFWVAKHDYIRAYELYTRMAIAGFADHASVAELRSQFPAMVALQTLAFNVSAMPEISRLVLSDAFDAEAVAELLRTVGLGAHIAVTADTGDDEPSLAAATAVLAASAEVAQQFAARGYDPRFIFEEQDLTRFVLV
ncbi:glycosyltransferase family A protein [Novosphingobium album (ex Hu et al. 2023)]|uniref:Glycosyltransferase family 2 protein n=1 Tax=Novosphingobium album (ex Hu et al. 2023) TaxID=2930093 RepID=A0ABT0B309_9SPHN|nr:glycosyltransferase family A protein [Novosphingobium album (ex Hu et al. 2023)]MCJ2179353.1 glycosyltransferase family 2 protein [Novosphingobium album (ex Hu et al. 2023)]